MPHRIAIVDDRAQIIVPLAEELSATGFVEIMFTARNGQDYLQQMKECSPARYPEVVLMDIEMPVMNGIDAVKRGSMLYANVEYIMFTVFDDDDNLFEALKAGAKGYLLKSERCAAIIKAIDELLVNHGAPMSSGTARKVLGILINSQPESPKTGVPAGATLTAREIEILKGLVIGLDYKQLALQLMLSPNTIRNQIAAIYTKLHIRSKAQAITLAIKNKWV